MLLCNGHSHSPVSPASVWAIFFLCSCPNCISVLTWNNLQCQKKQQCQNRREEHRVDTLTAPLKRGCLSEPNNTESDSPLWKQTLDVSDLDYMSSKLLRVITCNCQVTWRLRVVSPHVLLPGGVHVGEASYYSGWRAVILIWCNEHELFRWTRIA